MVTRRRLPTPDCAAASADSTTPQPANKIPADAPEKLFRNSLRLYTAPPFSSSFTALEKVLSLSFHFFRKLKRHDPQKCCVPRKRLSLRYRRSNSDRHVGPIGRVNQHRNN